MNKNTELSKAFRQRRLDAGESEIRGIYAKTESHSEIKTMVKVYIKKSKSKSIKEADKNELGNGKNKRA